MEIELLSAGLTQSMESFEADLVWLPDQPSPFGEEPANPYGAILLHEKEATHPIAGAHRYKAGLVTGKEGQAGPIQLLALIQPLEGQSREEAFRHWDEHIPLAVKIHHKALRYRQFRLTEKLSMEGPDYFGFAVLDFAGPEDLRNGLYRNDADIAVISADVREFISHSDVMYGTERAGAR